MRYLDPYRAAREAPAAASGRPATAILYDSPDARLVVFRIAPGQGVRPHCNASTVLLTVLEGACILSGAEGERAFVAGDIVVYEPNELHAMRADGTETLLLATIAPRPGGA